MQIVKAVSQFSDETRITVRTISLLKLDEIYYWTCSVCLWRTCLSSSPVHALEEFSSHVCADHSLSISRAA
jgi:hypothetical protein